MSSSAPLRLTVDATFRGCDTRIISPQHANRFFSLFCALSPHAVRRRCCRSADIKVLGGTISSGRAAGILRRSLMNGIRGAAVQSGGGDAGPAKASTFAPPRLQPWLISSFVHQLEGCNNVTPASIVGLQRSSASPHNHQLGSTAGNE